METRHTIVHPALAFLSLPLSPWYLLYIVGFRVHFALYLPLFLFRFASHGSLPGSEVHGSIGGGGAVSHSHGSGGNTSGRPRQRQLHSQLRGITLTLPIQCYTLFCRRFVPPGIQRRSMIATISLRIAPPSEYMVLYLRLF